MRTSLLTVAAALLLLGGCQKTTDNAATTGDAATGNMASMSTSAADSTAPVSDADAANGSPNSRATPDTLAPVQGAATTSQTAADANFIMQAAAGGIKEVELGKLAQVRGTEAMVKEMGGMMVQDHTKANDELKSLAARKDVKVPAALDPDGQKGRDQLSQLKGKEFDQAYIAMMVDDHQKTIKLFQTEANNGNDPDLRKFADHTLPTLMKHADMFQKHQKM